MNLRNHCVKLTQALALVAVSHTPISASITWNITYNDVVNTTGVGFDDPTFGAARQSTAQAVFDYLNTVVDESGTVDFIFQNSQTDGSGFLASSGPLFFTGPNGFENGFLFDHATSGVDPLLSREDASATFDFGYTWNSETDSPTGSEFDLFSVTLHEITHSLGFLSLVDSAGLSAISGGDPGVFSVYNSFLERGDGTPLFSAGGNYDGTAADLTSDDVFFAGPNATAANGGSPVQVHAPGTFTSGSSISHLDNSVSGVMNFSIAPGVEQRSYASVEIGILQDIGWTIAAVPEVSGVLILIPVLGASLCCHRRRRVA